MKKLSAFLLAMLMMTVLLTACGGGAASNPAQQEEDTGPSINYEDYVQPVVDRKVSELITVEELSTLMTVEVQLVIDTDSMASYQSENGYYMVTLSLENKTRDEFDAMVADATVWTAHAGVGEAAYWGVDQTELVAYQDGYAFSVSGYHVYYGCMESIMKKMLASLA